MNDIERPGLPIDRLLNSFDDVSNSYKFFWFMALLQCIQDEQEAQDGLISFNTIVRKILARAWLLTQVFRLSLGKIDKLANTIQLISDDILVRPTWTTQDIERELELQDNNATLKGHKLLRYVPWRFLTPWFEDELAGLQDAKKNKCIEALANQAFGGEKKPLYRFRTDGNRMQLELDLNWAHYLRENSALWRDYCLWHLTRFLEKRNPNIPNIATKLGFLRRGDLTKARKLWSQVICVHPDMRCIYSGKELLAKNFDLDHFIPWSFVAHDEMWNLIPADPSFNSKKKDRIPRLKSFLEPFVTNQIRMIRWLKKQENQKCSFLREYADVLKIDGFHRKGYPLEIQELLEAYRDVMDQRARTALANGFNLLNTNFLH